VIAVYVCSSGRSFSSKLSEIHEAIKAECTPIIACFDVGSESNKDHYFKAARQPKFHPSAHPESPLPSPTLLRREITFSSESDESYGLQLLSRIASDLQVEEGAKVIIPVAIVQPKRNNSIDQDHIRAPSITRSPYGSETAPATVEDKSDVIDPQMMLQCLDAGALDVVKSPLDKAGIMGLTVHAYRVYKKAKKEQAGFMALAKRGRKQSWVGVEDEKPYAYLREAMVKKLLKGICEPETVIEDYQHRGLNVTPRRREIIAEEVGKWGFCGHDFDEDELVYAGYCMLNHALKSAQLEGWRMSESKSNTSVRGVAL
jgi:3',5'-cyclic-nucleotide phosphodiesterase